MGIINFRYLRMPKIIQDIFAPVTSMKEPKHMVAFGIMTILAASLYINATNKRPYLWYEKIILMFVLGVALTIIAGLIVKF